MSAPQDLQGPISQIYHEKQQPGSMLCAQHALNNLLRKFYFHHVNEISHFMCSLIEANYVSPLRVMRELCLMFRL